MTVLPKYSIRTNRDIPVKTLEVWQRTVNMLATLSEVPAALVTRVQPLELEILTASDSEGNVYEKGVTVPLDGDNYCEAVIASDGPVLVEYAPDSPDWDEGRHSGFGMNAYYGIPIHWPHGEVFGTLCVLDEKRNDFKGATCELMKLFCRSIEENLSVIVNHQEEIEKRKIAEAALSNWETILNNLILSVKGVVGEAFLSKITCELSKQLSVKHVYIGLLDEGREEISTLEYAFEGNITANRTYSLEDSPCTGGVINNGIYTTSNLNANFREVFGIAQVSEYEYLSVPLVDSEEKAIGVLVLIGQHNQKLADIIKIITDIIAIRISNELERISAYNDLVVLQKKTDEISQAKSKFLAIMSHELRTPLNAIIGFSDFIASQLPGMKPEKIKEYVDDIQSSGKHLLAIVGDILDLTKLEAGKVELNVQEFDIAEVIKQSLKLVEGGIEDKKIALEVNIKSSLIKSDQLILKQILINLLSNAVKFNKDKGQILVDLQQVPNGDCIITIEDTGIGMTDKEVSIAKDRFVQVGHEHVRRAGGSGLGLSLVDGFVKLLSGDLKIQSQKNIGTAVILSLPGEIIN